MIDKLSNSSNNVTVTSLSVEGLIYLEINEDFLYNFEYANNDDTLEDLITENYKLSNPMMRLYVFSDNGIELQKRNLRNLQLSMFKDYNDIKSMSYNNGHRSIDKFGSICLDMYGNFICIDKNTNNQDIKDNIYMTYNHNHILKD